MRKILLYGLVFFVTSVQAQFVTNEIINPKGKWYFGAEIGQNTINSFTLGEPNQRLQGGVLAEYYFARHWSLSGKIKYFETGVSYFKPEIVSSGGGWFNIFDNYSRPSLSGSFQGQQLAIPINIKWEFRVRKNFGGNLKIGYVQIFETSSKSIYKSNSNHVNFDNDIIYGGINIGYGLNYFLNDHYALYLDIENYSGGDAKGFTDAGSFYTKNSLLSLGVKYNFKK